MKKKKKFSWNERVSYHSEKYRNFVDGFRYKTIYGTNLDFDKLEAAEKKNSKMQYSDGFSTFASDIWRGRIMSADDLNKKSPAFQRGFKAAKSAFDKSRNIKF